MNKKKKFLIVGSGGRESAFALRLAEEEKEAYSYMQLSITKTHSS